MGQRIPKKITNDSISNHKKVPWKTRVDLQSHITTAHNDTKKIPQKYHKTTKWCAKNQNRVHNLREKFINKVHLPILNGIPSSFNRMNGKSQCNKHLKRHVILGFSPQCTNIVEMNNKIIYSKDNNKESKLWVHN